jgi:hypothetical protein
MNILYSWMTDHPEVVDELASIDGDTVSLDALSQTAIGHDFPVALDSDSLRDLREDDVIGPLLERSYLALPTRASWINAIERTTLDERIADHRDWVAFASGSGDRGVTMPDDSHPILQVAMFIDTGRGARRIGLEYRSIQQPPTGVSLSVPVTCSLPDWGACSTEQCEGCCELRQVPRQEGLVCVCPNA